MTANDNDKNEDKDKDTSDFILKRADELNKNPGAKRRKEYEEMREEKREQDTTIEKYCRRIRDEEPFFERSFEEYEMGQAARESSVHNLMEEHDLENKEIPEGIKTHWFKEKRRKKQEIKDKKKHEKEDNEYLHKMSPYYKFLEMIDKIDCRCNADSIRKGEVCSTCRLIGKVSEFTLRLFEDAANR